MLKMIDRIQYKTDPTALYWDIKLSIVLIQRQNEKFSLHENKIEKICLAFVTE